MTIHYRIVIIRMKENQGLQMGQKFRKLLKEKMEEGGGKKKHT